MNTRLRLLISITISGLVYILLWRSVLRPATSILIAWNCGTICFLGLIWLMMLRATPEKTRFLARVRVSGRWGILTLVVSAACSSLLAIVYILADTKGLSELFKFLHIILAGFTLISSWALIHTMFALQYGRMYYSYEQRNNGNLNNLGAKGLDFPGDNPPDYWDFLYFSFVIGMTSQVSDVPVRSHNIRRLTLIHSVLTFFFNTMILALSINIIASLI
ncbi:MAG: DUF1345 domain-containing protein [Scytonema sp. PMC 1070.18]|nr:DUF1345 domain-containing protein [Scytonema sp. PMC 1070.18]